jgi:integrin beta 3
MELNTLADEVFNSVKGYVLRSLAPMSDRIKALENRGPERGEKGEPGRDGIDGKSVETAPIVESVLDQVMKALDQIPPPKDGLNGKDGAAGKDGQDGKPGLDGKDGIAGKDGQDGKQGLDGKDADPAVIRDAVLLEVNKALDQLPAPKDGTDGQDGIDGRDGRDGEPGRDAIQIEVLDHIDSGKKYQRGTYAHYRGGIVRSFKVTDPITENLEKSGWHVVVEGIADTEVDMSERTVTIRTVKTGGAVIEKSFNVPTMIYRGIWAERGYEFGDTVTWDGSLWHCEKASSDKPGTSDAWKLCTKRGRDGRDGLRGEKGERGAEGRAGKDLTQMGFDGGKY